ncbi:MAG: MarR family transcriptional regulator [Alphaproteobacteria bacterium CG11_big_fil_rev_8_21_14_0_20_39_49]|nr:MAG: MarR family transcriptional regulator [Alphaproteobacteria bacterium CG11_big_fil_rev_8_21_14_0_20_39_49]
MNMNSSMCEEDRYGIRILQGLRKIMRSVDIHSRQLNTQYEITAPQLIVMLDLMEKGSQTIASIAKNIYLSPSTLVGIIDRLEAKNFVQRERSENDRRQVLVSITKDGRNFCKKAPSPLQATLAKSFSSLERKEQETICKSLERIVELMDVDAIDAAPILQSGDINS